MVKSLFRPLALALCVCSSGALASPLDIDFSSYAINTPVSSVDGVSFSLMGSGPGPLGTPEIDSWGNNGLSNSVTGEYPTSNILDVLFNAQVTNVSFQFDNYGSGSGSYVQAFNGATLVETDSVDSLQGAWFSLTTTSAITELQFNNNTGGDSSWLFDVNSITANVPEPSSLLLALISVAGLTVSRRRRH